MVKLGGLRTDPALEKGGVWRTYQTVNGSVRFLLGRIDTPEAKSYTRKLSEPLRDSQGQITDAEAIVDVINKTAARYGVLGWEGLEDDNGKTLKHSEDAALALLRDEGLRDWREWALSECGEADNYRKRQEEAIAKN